jgi:putative transposase
VAPRDEDLLPRIPGLKAEPPCWGSRRIWAYPHCVERLAVNQKHVFRVRQEPNRLVKPHPRLQAKRTPTRSKPRPTRPHEWWGLDMPKVLGDGFG